MKRFIFFVISFLLLANSVLALDEDSDRDEYVYDPIGRRDPFKPFKTFHKKEVPVTPALTKVVPTTKAPPKVIEITDPLLKYSLEEYTVVAIMWDTLTPRALVKDREGGTHVISKSSRIGNNSGLVQNIRDGEIVVVERVEIDGKFQQRTQLLEVPREKDNGVTKKVKK